jgi:hypothetical protein
MVEKMGFSPWIRSFGIEFNRYQDSTNRSTQCSSSAVHFQPKMSATFLDLSSVSNANPQIKAILESNESLKLLCRNKVLPYCIKIIPGGIS